MKKFPEHIAIIMDGNGRWAKRRNLPRFEGHREGANALRGVVRAASELGVRELTLYAFSCENWKRPKLEVNFLMKLLEHHLVQQRAEIMRLNVRFSAIGRLGQLPKSVLRELYISENLSRKNTGMHARLALNYGGRQEILDAFEKFLNETRGKKLLRAPTEKGFRKFLYDPKMSDPDLLIRTGQEMRVSNFLLWEISYSEIYATPVLWPDFGRRDLKEAIEEYSRRERRFGGL